MSETSPWSQFIKKHERSYTCVDQDGQSGTDKFYKPSAETSKWVASMTTSQQENSSPIFGKPKQRIADMRHSKNQSQIQPRTSLPVRNSSIRGNVTNRVNQQKSTRQLSRDLEKVQRIIEIDNDIIKSQINNLNSDFKIRKDNMDLSNKMLIERTNKLQTLILQQRKQKIKFTEMFEKSMTYFKDKLDQQAQINNKYSKEIHELQGTIKLLQMNNKAVQVLDRSSSKRDSSPLTRRGKQNKDSTKYIQKIKLLQFQLNQKNKQLQQYQHNQNSLSLQNSLTFQIQRCNSFSKADKQTKQVLINCEELYSLCQTLIQIQPTDPSLLDYLNTKLKQSIIFFKQSINPHHQRSCLSQNSSFKKTSMRTDRSNDKFFQQNENDNLC